MKPKEINLKYDIGDEVWLVRDNIPGKYEISEIKVIRRKGAVDNVTYFVDTRNGNVLLTNRTPVYRTKQSLQEALFRNL